ncbi:putative membrane protein [Bartonella australis AUST/NH1]|uniref:Putative membrane protein n=1 Tax=Bartonella australis (strain Aust/NH1) TaxID=1094489 RepID=M1PEA0_BARAA|nr:hypothetical protein [Bartonella australis]AGF74946.1 putative membrane protein [Bartonella australis AUST/NH1]
MVDKQTIYTPSNQHSEQHVPPAQDQPLDPAVERVRKKLMRLMMIAVSVTIILILAVFVGIIYKVTTYEPASKQIKSFPHLYNNPQTLHHILSFPKGTQILSQSLSEHKIVLKIVTPDQQIKFMIYNYDTGALVATFSVEETEEAPVTQSPQE